jgi:hypothetical protein
MSAWVVALVTFACVFGSALAAMELRRLLPEHHLREESKDLIRLVTGLMATLSALVLGLLIASAKSSYDSVNEVFKASAAKVILIDRTLAEYGPEAEDARKLLRNAFAARIDQLFPAEGSKATADDLKVRATVGVIELSVQALSPASERQRTLQARALQLSYEISQARWSAFEEVGTRTPPAMLVILVLWLAAMFASFGLFAPRNRTTVTALVIGALAVATSIFLIEEMGDPLGGVIKISSTPMRNALAQLGK